MEPEDLHYKKLQDIIKPYVDKGRPESSSFLNWFLEYIFRLDETSADDVLCDSANDKGIDGIYVDHVSETIHVLQSKVKQTDKPLGDAELKGFAGSLDQLRDSASVNKILSGNANPELKRVIINANVPTLIDGGYTVHGDFVCNQEIDQNAAEYLGHREDITVYTRSRIAEHYIDVDLEEGINDEFRFSCSDAEPYVYEAGNRASMFLFGANALELVNLRGIKDGSLFSQNVRLDLGKTKVNKDIAATISNPEEHIIFPLFHNGLTVLCESAEFNGTEVIIRNYVVVNGAQSLSALYANASNLTSDLRLLVKVIEVKDDTELSRKITTNSNNQNAIKPRDLRANHSIQLRLKKEFQETPDLDYVFEVKRGEKTAEGKVITNDLAGRELLAFDAKKPYSCHQIYKVFDENYSDIFGGPNVTAYRIVFINELKNLIDAHRGDIENRPMASYALTGYFLLYCIREILDKDELGTLLIRDPKIIMPPGSEAWNEFFDAIGKILRALIVDFNYEVRDGSADDASFDYKRDLKSPTAVNKMKDALLRSYEKDIKRGKESSLVSMCPKLAADKGLKVGG